MGRGRGASCSFCTCRMSGAVDLSPCHCIQCSLAGSCPGSVLEMVFPTGEEVRLDEHQGIRFWSPLCTLSIGLEQSSFCTAIV